VLNKLIHVGLTFLVFVYIIFEELVWETFAKPIYEFIHSLKILKKIEDFIAKLNRYIVLILFLSLFIQAEFLGIVALAFLAKGNVLTSFALYGARVPLGAFTFWLFKISQDKLMTFSWFKTSYDFIMRWIDKIKKTQTYKDIKLKSKSIKTYFKQNRGGLKAKFKSIYATLKGLFNL
jgi:ABC-type multidrug transport system fused ATPase/permease subunit